MQVSNALGEARNAASSFQKSVAKAFRSEPQQEFSMGLSAGPRPAPIPGYVRLMQSGTIPLPLIPLHLLSLHQEVYEGALHGRADAVEHRSRVSCNHAACRMSAAHIRCSAFRTGVGSASCCRLGSAVDRGSAA